MPSDAILVIAPDAWGPQAWVDALKADAPERPVWRWPDVADRLRVKYALAWGLPKGALADAKNLELIFSMGAGVDHLMGAGDLPDVPIVRIVSADLTKRMTEWVTLQVLHNLRRGRTYAAQQMARHWHEMRGQPAAGDVRVGIMGMGVLGRDAAEVLVRLGFPVAGWSRRGSHVRGVESFAGAAEFDAFLARTDILVSLLPLTPETRGLLAMPLFRKLAQDGKLGAPILINAGRGGSQVEADIVAALDAGILGGASLDVFETEPLPEASPLWSHPLVTITPHAAAWSSPAQLVPPILAQIAAYEAGGPLSNVVDRKAGY